MDTTTTTPSLATLRAHAVALMATAAATGTLADAIAAHQSAAAHDAAWRKARALAIAETLISHATAAR